jgi:hypothetical protein
LRKFDLSDAATLPRLKPTLPPLKNTAALLLAILVFTLPVAGKASSAESSLKRRLLFTEYGKGPNRFVELAGDGKLVREFKPPRTKARGFPIRIPFESGPFSVGTRCRIPVRAT